MRKNQLIAPFLVLFSSQLFALELSWSVENGFQQFRNAADFKKLKDAWPKGATPEEFLAGQSSASLREILPINDTHWDRERGRYDKDRLFNPEHSIVVMISGSESQSCIWSLDGSVVEEDVPCSDGITFNGIKEGQPFKVEAILDTGERLVLIDQKIRTTYILGLGDSFASGEGNPDHAAVLTSKADKSSINSRDWFLKPGKGNGRFEAQAEWWDPTCHRSLLAWQSLYAMEKAISDPHLVVRYASFACSGGEVYDGYFRAQLNPPGSGSTTRVKSRSDRDGGNVTKVDQVFVPRSGNTSVVVEDKRFSRRLNKSQLNAAIELGCVGMQYTMDSHAFRPQRDGLRNSPYYGNFKYKKCIGESRQPDEILVSFGGNDFGFSGVVAWGLFPKKPTPGVLENTRRLGLGVMREFVGVESPAPAGRIAVQQIGNMYMDLEWSFTNLLKAKPGSAQALVYPNPLPDKFPAHCSSRMSAGNTAMTQFFMHKSRKIPILKESAKNFIFRVEESDAIIISKDFVIPLQNAQRIAIAKAGWRTIESQQGFIGKSGERTMCGVTQACEEGVCDIHDLVAWANEKGLLHDSIRALESISQWEPYSGSRVRGLRFSNDSVLTQATFDANDMITDDWLNGSVHPVAQVHAGIATSMTFSEGKGESVSSR